MDFRQEYEKWLSSPSLSAAEKAELEAIRSDPKEIESRFYGPLEFGTAGLRGTMCVGLHHMNIHVVATTPPSLPGRPPASWPPTAFTPVSLTPYVPPRN